VNWSGFDAPFGRRRVPVPTYAFQRRRYWLEPTPTPTPVPAPVPAPTPAPVPVSEPGRRGPALVHDLAPNIAEPDRDGLATMQTMEVSWEPVPLVTRGPQTRRYLVIGGEHGPAAELARRLRGGAGAHVDTVLTDGAGVTRDEQPRPGLAAALAATGRGPTELHIVFAPAATEVPGASARLLTDVRTILEFAVGPPAAKSLWLVGQGGGPEAPATARELSQAGMAALARTINAEHPDVHCVALSVAADLGPGDLGTATTLIDGGAPDGEEQLAVRDGRAHRARLRAFPAGAGGGSDALHALPIRHDGTYLITGGTGGIGLRLALATARTSPARVVLVSRSGGANADDPATWDALLAMGARVDVVRADVADQGRMREVLDECGPGLRGVFHCAGHLDDGILLRQTPPRSAAVLRPKVDGAWLLHTLTRSRDLDFLVLFSSLASLLGYRGQGSYAVANEFLDSLARYRHRHGLPALSVSWGSWADSGMTRRLSNRHRSRLRDEGEDPIPPDEGIAVLASLMRGTRPHAAVARMDWAGFAAQHGRCPSMIKALVANPNPVKLVGGGAEPSFAERLRAAAPDAARTVLRDTVTAVVHRLLDDQAGQVDPTRGFEDLGVDSLGALDLRRRLQTELGVGLPATLAFDYPCLDELVRHLEERHFAAEIEAVPGPRPAVDDRVPTCGVGPAAAAGPPRQPIAGPAPVAIIGMSCRLPGAASPEEFWQLLVEGRDAIREIPADRWDLERLYDAAPDAPGTMHVRRAALIDDVASFDAAFFGISPREAASMDPRHRLLLEGAWSAIENAGIDPASLRGSDTAVYFGCDEFTNDYLRQAEPQLGAEPYLATGTTLSFSAGRLSYKLGLHGPSIVIATACSSSLVALHSAVQAIRHGECGMAIVGGAKLMLDPTETVQLCKLGALAPDGVSKAFSADADGFGRGEGVATVLLKSLDRAVADGDPVLAVVRGTAVNHDGPSSGLTVPNGGSQSRLIAKALADAGLTPSDVTYLETHGTGTQLGDPIEIHALGEAFRGRAGPLLIGSVKANIGHLEEASGLAGVVKTVLALQHEVIPPQIHCDVLNDKVDWRSLPLAIRRTATDWPHGAPRIAGVSSFGMSGTNAHVVLAAYEPSAPPPDKPTGPFVFPFSARDEADLAAMMRQFLEVVDTRSDLAEIAWTLQAGRKQHRCRHAVVALDASALRERIEAFLRNEPDPPDGAGRAAGAAATGRGRGAATLAQPDIVGLARAWCDGRPVDWRSLYPADTPRRVALPSYPFKRNRLWIGEEGRAQVRPQSVLAQPEPLPAAVSTTASPLRPDTLDDLRSHVAELLGLAPSELPTTTHFDELGADSLTFMRISQFVRDRFQVVISFQQLIEEAVTLDELATIVSSALPRPVPAAAVPAAAVPAVVVPAAAVPAAAVPAVVVPARLGFRAAQSGHQPAPQAAGMLTERQSRFLSQLIDAYSARTRGSKAEAQQDRSVLANCRMPPWQALCKEMSYPLVVDRSAGARFWDVDGNEYLDISMGYGVHLFGHQPAFVVDALRTQLDKGFHIGPQASRSGRVARLLCELTGMSRAVFCNSGTEAVMAALRFARAATSRTRFAMFEGSYHGWSDNTLALPAGADGSVPMARGIGAGAMNDVVVLEYGAPDSLKAIRALGPELAAVLVEPVQSRRPDLQPIDFLRELRALTRESGTALIFDEVITGFRIDPGGAQVWSGVDADIVTYGKILGGGMPIGAVAGRAEFMDTVDGGAWKYGDDSGPTVPTTFFGGTFNKNPLAMAAADAVLTHLRSEGPELQQRLADAVARLADDLNAFCRQEGFPLRVVHFSSLFRFIGEGDYSLQRFPLAMDLFFYLLILRGIYVLETRVCFLSTSHTADDVRFIVETAKSCLRTLRGAGFFEITSAAAPAALTRERRLVDDARLDLPFFPPRSAPSDAPGEVLLTGATGFLGAYLTADLLRDTRARIHCLVRARDAEHARERVLDNLAATQHLDGLPVERIAGVPADLSEPRLGLDDRTWRRLAGTIDAIYHNGAQVNSLLPYERLRAANVDGTRELLRLAIDGRSQAFHYVSSDAVFDAYGYHRQATIYEGEPLAHSDSLYGGGYAETKWVADKLLENARAAGLNASIYRPGMLTGALAGGCGQLGDFFARFLRGIVQLGVCPELDGTIDFAPVDVVARMIVRLSLGASTGLTYHLTHPEPISYREFVDGIRKIGYDLDVVPLHVWDATLAALRYEDDNALYPLLTLFTESSDPVFRRCRLDVRNTARGAGALARTIPPLLELIPLYLERFSAEGLLPRSAATRPPGGLAR
jgi:thioester reductase-like protein